MVTGWKDFVIGNSGQLIKESTNPQLRPSDFFTEYSMPAFDSGKVPSKSKGTEMHSNRTVISDDILLFNKLNVRKRRVWRIRFAGENAVCSGEFLPYKSSSIDLDLLGQILLSDSATKYFEERSTGTSNSQKRITPATFLNYVVTLPEDIAEQRRIAKALSDVDSLIESIEKLIFKKKDVKKGVMQELLTGIKRLPGFSGDWKSHSLGEYCYCIRGVSYDGTDDVFSFESSETVRLLRSNNIQEARFVDNDIQFVRRSRAVEQQILRDKDIMVCMANGSKALVGKSCYFDSLPEGVYTFGAFMGCVRAKECCKAPKYLYYLMNSDEYFSNIAVLLSGSSINNLRPSYITDMTFIMPDDDEQVAITEVLQDIDHEIESMQYTLEKYKQLKAGMMSKLLTGEIRFVEEDEKDA